MAWTAKTPPSTQQIFDRLPNDVADRLSRIRQLILETASENSAIGPLEETIKWGEPAFLTKVTKSGTTIRINRHKKYDCNYAMYVNCRTNLVERYKQIYGDLLKYDGARAIVFDVGTELPVEAVKHCIAMALTYHLNK